MSNWIFWIGIVVLELTIIAVGVVVCRKIEGYFGEVLPVYKEMTGCYEKIVYNIEGKFDSLHKIFEAQKELTDQELKAYNLMNEHIQNLGDMHKELLQCWRAIEDRYSDTYEQFAELNERFQKFQIDIPQNVIEQISDKVKDINIEIDPNIAPMDPLRELSNFLQGLEIPKKETDTDEMTFDAAVPEDAVTEPIEGENK